MGIPANAKMVLLVNPGRLVRQKCSDTPRGCQAHHKLRVRPHRNIRVRPHRNIRVSPTANFVSGPLQNANWTDPYRGFGAICLLVYSLLNSCPIPFSFVPLPSIAGTRQLNLFFEDLDAQVYTLTADANLTRPRYQPLDLFPFFATEGTFQCQARFLRTQHGVVLCSFLVALHPEQPNAFVTDIDAARTRNQTPYLILVFAAKGAMIRRSLSFHHAVTPPFTNLTDASQ